LRDKVPPFDKVISAGPGFWIMKSAEIPHLQRSKKARPTY